jgi:hypothetical protein
MIFFLTTQPIWVSGAIIVGLGTLLSVGDGHLVDSTVRPHSMSSTSYWCAEQSPDTPWPLGS